MDQRSPIFSSAWALPAAGRVCPSCGALRRFDACTGVTVAFLWAAGAPDWGYVFICSKKLISRAPSEAPELSKRNELIRLDLYPLHGCAFRQLMHVKTLKLIFYTSHYREFTLIKAQQRKIMLSKPPIKFDHRGVAPYRWHHVTSGHHHQRAKVNDRLCGSRGHEDEDVKDWFICTLKLSTLALCSMKWNTPPDGGALGQSSKAGVHEGTEPLGCVYFFLCFLWVHV